MAVRSRTGASLIDDAYKRADNESATDRHPRTDVLRYCNQGGAELWDLIIEARGMEYCQATPTSITTTASTTSYSLDDTFYLLISVYLDGTTGGPIMPFSSQEEPLLRTAAAASTAPLYYQLNRTAAGANTITILPTHSAGLTIKVRWVPVFTDLTDNSSNPFAGVNGWEEYIVAFAARCMAVKDEEWNLAQALDRDMERLRERIQKLAPKRDLHRARRVKDVRGPQVVARGWRLFGRGPF